MVADRAVRLLTEIARKERVDEGVGSPPIEDEVRAQVPFALESDAFQDALRRRVGGFNERLNTAKARVRERPTSKERDGAGRKATTTSTFDQPVADFDVARLRPKHQHNSSKRLVRASLSDCEG